MADGLFLIGMLVLFVAASIYCPFWFKRSDDAREKMRIIPAFIFFVVMSIVMSGIIIDYYDLFWEGQSKENAHIELAINDAEVEQSSFIRLLERFDANTTIDDVISVMGENYQTSASSGYEMRYMAANYTINDHLPLVITFTFNRNKTKILSIAWSYKSPPQGMFNETLQYLENNALGKADSSSTNKADWKALHLEDNGYYLLFKRYF